MQCGHDPMNDLFGTYQCPRKMCSIYSNACSDLKISITNADTGTGTCMAGSASAHIRNGFGDLSIFGNLRPNILSNIKYYICKKDSNILYLSRIS